MISVVIVDDEPIIRSGIAQIIPWEEYGCSKPHMAKNGEEALSLIRQYEARIVISDIKMPKMDGLELLNCVNQLGLDVFFIVVSGYDEFQYVQRAINNGAFGYLLKPLVPEELETMVASAVRRIGKDTQTQARTAPAQTAPQTDISWLPAYLNDTLPAERKDQLQSRIAEENRMWHTVFLSHFLTEPDDTGVQELLAVSETVLEQERLTDCAVLYLRDRQYLYTLLRADTQARLEQAAGAYLRGWTRGCQLHGAALAQSGMDIGLRALCKMQTEAHRVVRYQRYFQKIQCSLADVETALQNWQTRTGFEYHYVQELLLAGETGRLARMMKTLAERAANHIEECQYAFGLLLYLCREAVQSRQPDELERMDSDYLSILTLRHTQEIAALAERTVQALADELNAVCARDMQMVIARVKAIVQIDYADSALSLGAIAARLGFNAAYLSHLFSSVEQCGFSEYLTRVRIQKARALLLTDVKIVSIAQLVGYSSQPYFSTKFRTETGLSPSEYREKYRKS